MRRLPGALALVTALAMSTGAFAPAAALANASHAGWPPLTGMLLMNKYDQSRPLDGRPGSDPFDGTDYSAPCPAGELHSYCIPGGIPVDPVKALEGVTCTALTDAEAALTAKLEVPLPTLQCTTTLTSAALIPATIGHNELLGGGGNDVIHAGPAGDVIWGDFKNNAQPKRQIDHLYGGAGNDFIYASHGLNYIDTGGGYDVVHAHFGRGDIHCNSASVTVYLSHADRRGWKLFGCKHITYKSGNVVV
jgi:Ca2+-binding RTX toxin-like protein